MTLLISWIGVDEKKGGKSIASLYIASDSRYSWGKSNIYDYGIKVFGSANFPEIFGFCGDVLFPSIVLGQIVPQIDSGLMLSKDDTCDIKNEKIYTYIASSLKTYPKFFLGETFTILHGTRVGTEFKCYETTYIKGKGIKNIEINLFDYSTKIFSGGSGSKDFNNNWVRWLNSKHNNYRTSRGVFHCMSKTLQETTDPFTGGLPQIVGLYRIKNSRLFGIVNNEKKYLYGKETFNNINSESVEWRNNNFERIDPATLKILNSAQRQPY